MEAAAEAGKAKAGADLAKAQSIEAEAEVLLTPLWPRSLKIPHCVFFLQFKWEGCNPISIKKEVPLPGCNCVYNITFSFDTPAKVSKKASLNEPTLRSCSIMIAFM